MKHAVTAIGGISTVAIPVLFYFKHITPALICASVAILCIIILAILGIKDRNLEKHKVKPNKPMGVGHDEDTGLIIKAISDETNNFATISDIVRDTNLPLKRIGKTLDWLFIHGWAKEIKVSNGKAYILTPEGRGIFSNLINKKPDKPQT